MVRGTALKLIKYKKQASQWQITALARFVQMLDIAGFPPGKLLSN